MVHLILTGATGLVGGSVLLHILSLPPTTSITRLSILSRSPVPLATRADRTNTKTQIEVINHTDYATYPPEVLEKLQGAKAVIWAQGISQNEVSKEDYVKITHDWPLAAAQAFSGLAPAGEKLNFIYVSGEGATHAPKFYSPIFARVKGETELALLNMQKQSPYSTAMSVYLTRPGGVLGNKQPEIWDPFLAKRPASYKVMLHGLVPVLKVAYKSSLIDTPQLGRALTEMALRDGRPYEAGSGIENDGRLITNVGLRRLSSSL